MGPDRRLTREEFDGVIRRAAELAAHEGEADEWTVQEVVRIARDVGLPERHVRRALAELREASGEPERADFVSRLFGPETVRVARVVPGTPSVLARTLDDFLVAGQLLQAVRRGDRILQYRPAVDWVSQVARAASSTSRRYYVASARSVEVRFDETDEGSLVEFHVDPGTRSDAVSSAVFGGLMGGLGAGAGVGALSVLWMPPSLALSLGGLAALTSAASIGWSVGRSHRRKLGEVRSEVRTVLDQLESGESLEPPPASWLRWVQRQFHGARRLLGEDGGVPRTGVGSS